MIQVKNLTKIYKIPKQNYKKSLKTIFWPPTEDKIGVDGVSFEIKQGEIIGFIGPNGAGKTTTIKMLTGILTPTAGEVNVFGCVPYQNRHQYTKQIGVVMGQRSILFYDIPVIESFKFFKDVYELDNREFKSKLALLSEKLDLQPLLKIPVRKLSLGQRMRCEVAASILHEPKILFLDEPTIGLDIIAKQRILNYLRELNAELNTTIFLTTHDINDIDRLCERVIILDKGKIHYDGDIDFLKSKDQVKIIEIMHNEMFAINPTDQRIEVLGQTPYKTVIRVEGDNLGLIINRLQDPNVRDFTVNSISLEEVLKEIYQDKVGERKNA